MQLSLRFLVSLRIRDEDRLDLIKQSPVDLAAGSLVTVHCAGFVLLPAWLCACIAVPCADRCATAPPPPPGAHVHTGAGWGLVAPHASALSHDRSDRPRGICTRTHLLDGPAGRWSRVWEAFIQQWRDPRWMTTIVSLAALCSRNETRSP